MKLKLDETRMFDHIFDYVSQFKTSKEAADKLGISAAYLSDVLRHKRDISSALARKFGFTKVNMYFSFKQHPHEKLSFKTTD